jgi:hypothetical protein
MKEKPHLLMVVLFLLSCSSLSEKEEILIGNWEAKWVSGENWSKQLPMERELYLEMNGKMVFEKNHELTITGYGYPGCIFSADTIENTLKWELDSNVINLYNQADSFIMAYQIQEINGDMLKFLFLEDIEITLTKTN